MSELALSPESDAAPTPGAELPAARKRPKPGERRAQILQALAAMLEQPGGERITTAALAARLSVSEAALYRHFASKAQMFEALIDFIESSIFTLVAQIVGPTLPEAAPQAEAGVHQARRVVALVLQFGERNPGMVRVMVGDALVLEHERLQQRMNVFFDKVELQLKDALFYSAEAAGSATPSVDAQVRAGLLSAYCIGQIQRFVRTGFKRKPTENAQQAIGLVL